MEDCWSPDFSVTIPRCYQDVYVNSFFPRTARLWNFLPIECFLLIHDLSGFNSFNFDNNKFLSHIYLQGQGCNKSFVWFTTKLLCKMGQMGG